LLVVVVAPCSLSLWVVVVVGSVGLSAFLRRGAIRVRAAASSACPACKFERLPSTGSTRGATTASLSSTSCRRPLPPRSPTSLAAPTPSSPSPCEAFPRRLDLAATHRCALATMKAGWVVHRAMVPSTVSIPHTAQDTRLTDGFGPTRSSAGFRDRRASGMWAASGQGNLSWRRPLLESTHGGRC